MGHGAGRHSSDANYQPGDRRFRHCGNSHCRLSGSQFAVARHAEGSHAAPRNIATCGWITSLPI
jgi:hypothetical protein